MVELLSPQLCDDVFGRAHNGGALTNAFGGLYPSPLMTVFISSDQVSADARLGADQMRLLATYCPV